MSQITFQDAIESSNHLIMQIDDRKIEDKVAFESSLKLLESSPSTRGFFVSLLTGNWKFGDIIPESIILACGKAPDTVNEILAKNLVMSSCMEQTHIESGDNTGAAGSKQVQRRVIYIISKLKSDTLKKELQSMQKSICAKLSQEKESKCIYVPFLVKWKYSDMQLEKAKETISTSLESCF